MPEGPSLIILKEIVEPFKNCKIIHATGNAKFDKSVLENKKILDFKTWGKQFFIVTNKHIIRIHFLLFGSYSINEHIKPDRSLRLHLQFAKGDIYFYTCATRLTDKITLAEYDWEADVMSDIWNPRAARKKLLLLPDMLVCDALLNQDIFSGVGNIIKNEVLYRIKVHPETRIGDLPAAKLNAMIKQARIYSFDFLEWKKMYELKKHWLAHTKKICSRCNLPIIKKYSGKTNRRTFFCENCQVKY